MPPALSVIVPAWNEADYLGDTLSALKRGAEQAGIGIETIVVDNASTDATRAIALDHGARVVDEPERRIARVRNTGARAAKAPGLLFVDADTRVEAIHLRAAGDALDRDWAGGGGCALRCWTAHRWSARRARWTGFGPGSMRWSCSPFCSSPGPGVSDA